jgi:hypothetical protein
LTDTFPLKKHVVKGNRESRGGWNLSPGYLFRWDQFRKLSPQVRWEGTFLSNFHPKTFFIVFHLVLCVYSHPSMPQKECKWIVTRMLKKPQCSIPT